MAKHHALKTLAAAVVAMGAHQAIAAPILQYNNTYLTGATDVQVGSSLFDVAFVAGSCSEVFGVDCVASNSNTATHTFTFRSEKAAIAADQALINELGTTALNGPIVHNNVAEIATPFEVIDRNSVRTETILLTKNLSLTALREDISYDQNVAYAVWTAQSTNVPEPASAPILLIGATALAVARRRRRL